MASQQLGSPSPKWCWFRFRYNEDINTPSETRNVVLVIVTLIAAVTYQAGVNPPGGVWQEDSVNGQHKAGRAIYAGQGAAFTVFLTANTLALSLAIQVIMSLTYKFPYNMELWIATISMFVTYASAIFAIAPDEPVKIRYVLIAGALPFGFQLLKKMYWRTSIASKLSEIYNAENSTTSTSVEFEKEYCKAKGRDLELRGYGI